MRTNLGRLLSIILSTVIIAVVLIVGVSFANLKKDRIEISVNIPEETTETNNQNEIEETLADVLKNEATEEPLPVSVPMVPIEMIFAGDILLSDYVLNNYNQSGLEGVLSTAYLQAMQDADITMVNQEFPFALGGTMAPDKQYTFKVDPKYVKSFSEMGIDIVTLANNHTLDFGEEALIENLEVLELEGIPYVGAGRNLAEAKALEKMVVNGSTIGFLGVSRVIPVVGWNATATKAGLFTTYEPSIPAVLVEIEKAKEECDFVVVYVHWGIERDEYPQEYQRTLGKQYIDAGADLVIGSHPHVLQGIEFYQGKPIVYSLGNFLFGSSIPKTMLLKVIYESEAGVRLFVLPGTSANGYTRDLEGAAGQELLNYLESISFGVTIDENGEIIEQVMNES